MAQRFDDNKTEIEELIRKLNEIEKVVIQLEDDQEKLSEGLLEIKEAAPSLLKVHQSLIEMQKKAQLAYTKAEEGKEAIENAKKTFKTLHNESETMLATEIEERIEDKNSLDDEIKQINLDIGILEEKFILNIQQNETKFYEELLKLTNELSNRKIGYSQYAQNRILVLQKTILNYIENWKKEIEVIKSKEIEQTNINKPGFSQKFIQKEVEQKLNALWNEINAELNIKKNELQEFVKEKRKADMQNAEKDKVNVIIETIENEYKVIVLRFETELEELSMEIQEFSRFILEKINQNETEKYKQDSLTALDNLKQKTSEKKKGLDTFKIKYNSLLGQLMQMTIPEADQEGAEEVNLKVTKKKEKLETEMNLKVAFYDKKIKQQEMKIEKINLIIGSNYQ